MSNLIFQAPHSLLRGEGNTATISILLTGKVREFEKPREFSEAEHETLTEKQR